MKHIYLLASFTYLLAVNTPTVAQVRTSEVVVEELQNTVVDDDLQVNGNLSAATISSGSQTIAGDLTVQGSFGRNRYRVIVVENKALTDGANTALLHFSLPTGTDMGGGYTVKVKGIVINGKPWSGSHLSKYYEGYVNWSQGKNANNNTGFITGTIVSSPVAGVSDNANLGAINLAGSRSGTNNSDHTIYMNADGSGTFGVYLYFSGTIEVSWAGFSEFAID